MNPPSCCVVVGLLLHHKQGSLFHKSWPACVHRQCLLPVQAVWRHTIRYAWSMTGDWWKSLSFAQLCHMHRLIIMHSNCSSSRPHLRYGRPRALLGCWPLRWRVGNRIMHRACATLNCTCSCCNIYYVRLSSTCSGALMASARCLCTEYICMQNVLCLNDLPSIESNKIQKRQCTVALSPMEKSLVMI